jgi:hypothetical protein
MTDADGRSGTQAPERIAPAAVRYIKLGRAGGWERECIEGGIVRFGTGSERPTVYSAALEGRWADVTAELREEGRDQGTATRFTNETRHFFARDPSTLWITFYMQTLWWAFLEEGPPQLSVDGRGTFRRVRGSWRSTDLVGQRLTIDRLAGSLTKSAAYRGTSFELGKTTSAYVVRRINGEQSPEVERGLAALKAVRASARELIALLEPRDFELLVDLVFTSSGWRRLGTVGGTQKTLDLDVFLPSTRERAFIQVKSATSNEELATYVAGLNDLGPFRRMFFVYHTGMISDPGDPRVVVIGPDQLSELVVDAGLVDWVIGKVS